VSREKRGKRDKRENAEPHPSPTIGDPNYYVLNPDDVDPARIKAERAKARDLKKSTWWQRQLQAGLCHYCGKKFKAAALTMDHVVPLARGGLSTPGNLVPACHGCNRDKKLETPAEKLLTALRTDGSSSGQGSDP